MSTATLKALSNYFLIPDNVEDKFKAECRDCGTKIQATARTQSNLTQHLQNKHPDKASLYKELRNKRKADDESQQRQRQLQLKDFNAVTAPVETYPKGHPVRKELERDLVNFIADNMLSLSIVDSPSFRQYSRRLDDKFKVPSRKILSKYLIHNLSDRITQTLKAHLQDAASVVLTIDLWSSRQMRGFMGVTAHYIRDWEFKTAMLSCRRFKGSHTAVNIALMYNQIVEEFDIAGKVRAVVTDNAANMMKAFRLGSEEESDLESESFTDDEDDDDDNPDEQLECVEAEENDLYEGVSSIHLTCICHSLQLCVKDGFKAAGQSTHNCLGRANNIIKQVRKSISKSEVLEDAHANRLQSANTTRWNSQLTAIRSLLNVPRGISSSVDQLSVADRKMLSDIIAILEPFEEATTTMQGDSSTGSLCIPTIQLLKQQLADLEEKYTSNKLLDGLITAVNTRLTDILYTDSYEEAMLLDPRIKDTCTDSLELAKRTLSNMVQRQSRIETVSSSPPPLTEPSTKRTKFSRIQRNTARPTIDPIDAEITSYLSTQTLDEEVNPLEFWRNSVDFPRLRSVVPFYLNCLSSSAPVERLFSIAGKTFRPERCRLSDKNFETLMNAKTNQHLV